MDSEALQELLRSPLDDVHSRTRFRLRTDHARAAGTAVLVGAGVVAFAVWIGGGITQALRDVVQPIGSVRVSVPPLDLQALTADPSTGRLIMMGGRSLAGAAHPDDLTDQTWQYADGSWWWLRTDGPPARQGHSLAFDTEAGVAVLFGGSATRYEPCAVAEWCGLDALGDTWTLDPMEGVWTQHEFSDSPEPRFGHAAAYDRTTGQVVVFGGATLEGGRQRVFDDTWTFDAPSTTWRRIEPVTSPPARAHHVMVAQPDGGVLLIGGNAPSLDTTDLWRFDGSNWSLVAADLDMGTRAMSAAAFDDETLLVFGGTGRASAGEPSQFFDDVLAVNPASGATTMRSTFPEKLWRHAAVSHPTGDGIVVVVRDRTLRYRAADDSWEDLLAGGPPSP